MKKILLILLALLFLSHWVYAREWKAYMAYHDATYNWPTPSKIYALSDGSIFTYIPGETQVHTFSKATGMSDCKILQMAYNEVEDACLGV